MILNQVMKVACCLVSVERVKRILKVIGESFQDKLVGKQPADPDSNNDLDPQPDSDQEPDSDADPVHKSRPGFLS